MKQLLEAGVHFGHQTRRWDPKMAEYIFQARNGIHIIDLQKTSKKLDEAYKFVKDEAEEGKWKWVTGEELSYTNWNEGEPNNENNYGNGENYAELVGSTGKWNDMADRPENIAGFIVEYDDITPSNSIFYNGNYYEVYSNIGKIFTWWKATDFAASRNGHLAVITSQAENDAIQTLIKDCSVSDFYIGGTDSDSEGAWRWFNGEAFEYSNWASGEPSNNNYYEGAENFLMLRKNGA